ncbi:MAG: SUMF1/EgtB/PvdO family nonheme iron enzyme, partial [Gammaproteobacteria bacterium]|nr:SUMF1/EgtB/PvdO family nonheme iron enzyme [Gammaproteobacteria bacterium]
IGKGYRLPTEAEWAWSARHVGAAKLLRFPWGDQLPPPDKHGNYADQSAAHTVGRIIFGYNDNYIASAPVGTFPPNNKGVYDLGGNVAEWVHDFYEIPDGSSVVDPLGPRQGDYHVIRGASWMHGTVSDLRLSGRDYGIDGRPDVGFRIARFAE